MKPIYVLLFIMLTCLIIEIINGLKHNHITSLTGNAFIDIYHQKDTFIDKTSLLKQVILTDAINAHLITCPERFGKTTNLKMIETFFELHWDSSNDSITKDITETPNYKIFSQLDVSKDTDLMNHHFAQYYVLYLNLGIVKEGKTYHNESQKLYDNVVDCISKYEWIAKKLMKDQSLGLEEVKNLKKYFKIMNRMAENTGEVMEGLTAMINLLKIYDNRGVILLVDDYEAPLLEALRQKTDYNKVVDILKSLYFHCYKATPKYIIFTGVSSTLLQHASPSLDFLRHYHFLDEHRWCTFCGFEEKHVDDLLQRHKMTENKQELTDFYNGYSPKNSDLLLYSPSPILEIIKNRTLLKRDNQYIPPYWTPTGAYQYLTDCYVNNRIRNVIGDLIDNNTFQLEDVPCYKLNTKLRCDFLHNFMAERCVRISEFHEALFFTYLFEHGYFKYAGAANHSVFLVSNENMKYDLAVSLKNFYTDETIISNHIVSEVVHEIIHTPGEKPTYYYNVTSADFPKHF